MPEHALTMRPKVAIIGAGPAGLTAAAKLAARLPGQVMVFDREATSGGIPRHADHLGYGIRDRNRFYSGPRYARLLSADAERAGAKLLTQVAVTGWFDEQTLEATSPQGLVLIRPEVFVFATGARERPRPARLIPGDRSQGIYTTGQLQNLVHLHHRKVGTSAVVVGAELVSWSAVTTLAEAGCRTEALVSQYPQAESYALFKIPGRVIFRTRVETNAKVVAIHGRPRVESVEIEEITTGRRRLIACDTVIFSGEWIPDNELLRAAGVELDPASLSPVVDGAMRTSRDGIFSVGNVNHPVETADVVALEGAYLAEQVQEYLAGVARPGNGIRLCAEEPIRWISPGIIRLGDPAPARNRLVAWVDRFIPMPMVEARQDGRLLGRMRLVWPAAPGRAFRIPAGIVHGWHADGGEVRISIR